MITKSIKITTFILMLFVSQIIEGQLHPTHTTWYKLTSKIWYHYDDDGDLEFTLRYDRDNSYTAIYYYDGIPDDTLFYNFYVASEIHKKYDLLKYQDSNGKYIVTKAGDNAVIDVIFRMTEDELQVYPHIFSGEEETTEGVITLVGKPRD